MKIALHITVEVDADDWCREYGIERRDIRADVRQYVETALAECPVPLLSVARPAKPVAEPAHERTRPGDATTGTPATPGGREAGEPTPGGPQDAQRGGEVRAVQPPPAAVVLAGAESRPDSGPTTLPDPRKGPGCRTAAGRPGPHPGPVPVLRAAAPPPPPPVPVPARPVRRRARLAPALIAAVVAAVVMLVAGAPGVDLPPGTVPAPAPVVATRRDRHPYNPDHGGVRASRRRAVANRTAVGPDPAPRRRACGLLALSLGSLVAGLTLLVGAAGAVVLTWWAG